LLDMDSFLLDSAVALVVWGGVEVASASRPYSPVLLAASWLDDEIDPLLSLNARWRALV
jgi:hypothetical protein